MATCEAAGVFRARTRVLAAVCVVGMAGLAGCSSAESGAPSTPAPSAPAASAPAAPGAPQAGDDSLAAAYHSPDGYGISPPAGWVLHPTDGQGGLSVVFAAAAIDKAAPKPFADNLNVVVTPTPATLDALVAETKQKYPSVLTNYKVVTDQSTAVNGHPAHLLGGTYDDARSGPLQNIQLILVEAGKEYTITFTSPAPSFDSFHAVVQASLSSFTLG